MRESPAGNIPDRSYRPDHDPPQCLDSPHVLESADRGGDIGPCLVEGGHGNRRRRSGRGPDLPCLGAPPVGNQASAPPERSATLCCRLATRAAPPPCLSRPRKSERCTATRLIAPSASTSTAFHPLDVARIT